jgi:glycerol-3-phosphate acyltransferase PlsY
MNAALVLVIALLAGAIPFSAIVAWGTKRVDLRDYGTGTVSGTGLFKVAGAGPLVVAGILDVGKGALGPALAGHGRPELAAVAGGMALVGHNWSPFLRGAGGRGFAPSLGALCVLGWPGAVLLLVALIVGTTLRKTGLMVFLAMAALTPLLGGLYGIHGVWTGLALAVPMYAKRLAGNRPPEHRDARTYARRLLFDHDGPEPSEEPTTQPPPAPSPRGGAGGTTQPCAGDPVRGGYRAASAPVDPPRPGGGGHAGRREPSA